MADDPDIDYFGGAQPPPALPPPSVAPSVAPSVHSESDATPDIDYFGSPAAMEPSKWSGTAGLPTPSATWSDVYHSGAGAVRGAIAQTTGAIASFQSDPVKQAEWEARTQAQEKAAQGEQAQITPGVSEAGISRPLVWAAGQAPGMGALVGAGAAAGPAGVGAVMAGMSRGEAYNRLVEQGITPTPETLDAVMAGGFLAGVIPGGAIAGKIATGPIVSRILSGGITGGIFGGQAVGQEALTEREEIRGGARKDYDPSAIVSQGVEQAEFGAPFGLWHGAHGAPAREKPPSVAEDLPANQAHTQTPGESTVGRRTPEQEVTEAKPRASTSATSTGGTGPAQPAAKVDPAQDAALAGKPITPGVKTQDQPVDQQPGVATTTAPPAQRAAEAPPAGDTTQPPPPPQPPPKTQPAATPAPPSADDIARAQTEHAALLDPENPRAAMVYPLGMQPIEITEKKGNFGQTALDDGRIVQYRKQVGDYKITKGAIDKAAKDGTLDQIVGPKATDTPSVAGSPAAAPERPPETAAPAAAAEAAPDLAKVQADIAARKAEMDAAERGEFAQPTAEQTPPVQSQVVEAPAPPPAPLKMGEFSKLAPDARQAIVDDMRANGHPSTGLYERAHEIQNSVENNAPTTEKVDLTAGRTAWTPELEAAAEQQRQRRTLRADTEEERAAQEAQRVAQDKAVAQVAEVSRTKSGRVKTETKEPEQQQPGKKSEADKAAMRASNAVADDVVRNNLPRDGDEKAPDPARGSGGAGARTQVLDRVKKMVMQATADPRGFKFMDKLRDRKDPELAHSASAVLLHEAKRLADLKVPKTSDFKRFLEREKELLKGEAAKADVLKERRAQGKEFAAAKGEAKEKAVEDIEGSAAAKETEGGLGDIEQKHVEALEQAKENIEAEKVAKEPGEERKLTENERRAQEASERARAKLAEQEARAQEAPREREAPKAEREEDEEEREVPKAAAEFKRPVETVTLKRRTITPKSDKDTRSDVLEDEAPARNKWGEPEQEPRTIKYKHGSEMVNLPVRGTTTARAIIERHFDLNAYPKALRPMVAKLRDAVVRIAGDTVVHFVSHDDLVNKLDEQAHGIYSPKNDVILLNADKPKADTPFHEAFHAATNKAINASPRLKALMERLNEEIKQNIDLSKIDAMAAHMVAPKLRSIWSKSHSAEELLTNMMTNPLVQNALKNMKISDELAKDIGIPKWRKATMWNGVVDVMRQALGLEPRETSAIEAAMSITEQAMWDRDPRMEAEAVHRSVMGDLGDLGDRIARNEELARDPKASLSGVRSVGERAGEIAKDAMVNAKAGVRGTLPRWLNGVQLSRYYGKMFTDGKGNIIDHLMELGRRKGTEFIDRMNKDLGHITQVKINAVRHKAYMSSYGRLLALSSLHQIKAEDAYQKPKGLLHERAMDDWQKNDEARWNEAHEIYTHLPDDLKKQYHAEREFYKDKQHDIGQQHIDAVLDNFPLPANTTREEMLDRINEHKLTREDEEHYTKLKALDDLRAAQRMTSGDTIYFPAYRSGGYVVTGRYAMPDGGSDKAHSGSDLPDNMREFTSRKQAHDYTVGTNMYAEPSLVRYAKDTGERLDTELAREQAEDASRGGKGNVLERYQVKLQREHTEMHQSYADAQRAIQEMHDNGVQGISGVLEKRKEGDWGRINTEFGQAMERRIRDRDDLTDDQKKAAIDAARSYALISRSGLQQHLVRRRNIAGADFAHADAVRSYSEVANRHMVNAKYAPKLDDAMKRMEAQDDLNRTTDDAHLSSSVANELRDRVYRDPNAFGSQNAPWINRLMQMAYMRWLVGPRHLMMMQTHPYVYSAPQIAGRHGAAAYAGMHSAARDLGGDLSGMRRGVGGTINQVRSLFARDLDRAAELGRTPDMTTEMISRLKDQDEIAGMKEGLTTGELHSGFGDEFYGASGHEKLDAMMRQLTSAQDAQNRAVVWLNAYRLEKTKTGSHEQAVDYARKMVQDTIGVNSPMDMGSAMRNPLARSFMQFKHFPLRQIELMGRNIYNGFKGETPEIKREAWRAFAHQVTTSFSMAGLHGLPIGLLKPLALLGYAMGVTPSPAQVDDRFRRMIGGMLGNTGANMFMDGVLAGVPHAPNMSNMFSRDMDVAFGEPQVSARGADWQGYIINTMGGAPLSELMNIGKGVYSAVHGDIGGAVSGLPMPRILPDIVKAWGLHEKGLTTSTGAQLTPASDADAAWKMLGWGTQQQARMYSGRGAAMADIADQQAAKAGAKGEQLRAKKQASQSIMGIRTSKDNRAMLRQREEAYQ